MIKIKWNRWIKLDINHCVKILFRRIYIKYKDLIRRLIKIDHTCSKNLLEFDKNFRKLSTIIAGNPGKRWYVWKKLYEEKLWFKSIRLRGIIECIYDVKSLEITETRRNKTFCTYHIYHKRCNYSIKRNYPFIETRKSQR